MTGGCGVADAKARDSVMIVVVSRQSRHQRGHGRGRRYGRGRRGRGQRRDGLLDLEGLAVQDVQRASDGVRVVRLETAEQTAAACPTCGVLASRIKEYVSTAPRDLPCGTGSLQLVWRKRRWHCDQPECARASFTESVPAVPARAG